MVPSYLDNGRVGTLLLPQYSPIRYDVRVVNIRTEDQQIEDYIVANKLTVTKKTDEGIRIAVTSAKPDSALAQTGQTASVLYKGKLLNGTQFDSRQDSTNAFSFKIGEGSVIKAWGYCPAARPERGNIYFSFCHQPSGMVLQAAAQAQRLFLHTLRLFLKSEY